MVKSSGGSMASVPGQGSTPYDWPRRIGNGLSDIVNYGHNRLEISVITKLL
jgi:hypothetical protein